MTHPCAAWAGQVHLAVCMLEQLGPVKSDKPLSRYVCVLGASNIALFRQKL